MRRRSPERSASGRALNPSQASICSTAKQLVQAGINAEDIPVPKASRSNSSVSELGDLHPRFKGNRISNQLRKKQANFSCIRWTCPPKFILNDDWHVAAGEQSEERRVQKQRESGVIDLVYSNPSTICSSHVDGHSIPIIPITPIEDGEADPHEVEPLSSTKENVNIEFLKQPASQLDTSVTTLKPSGIKTGLEADIDAAASAAFTALIKSKEQGSLIDTDLLIKLLNNPKMIELLKGEEKMANPSPSLSNLKKENSNVMQPSFNGQPDLNLTKPLSSASRDPVKEDFIKLTSGILAMLASTSEISSVSPPCSAPDMMFLLKQVCENQDKLLKQAHTSSDLMKFNSSADTSVPISELPSPQKLENDDFRSHFTTSRSPRPSFLSEKTKQPIRDEYYYKSLVRQQAHMSSDLTKFSSSADMSVPKSKPPSPQKLENDFRSHFNTSRPPQPSFLSRETKQPIRDKFYYKNLVRQHGAERQEAEGQKLNPAQFDSQISLRAHGNLSTHPQRQEHRKQKACIYFNTPKGCRLGLSCPYRHEFSSTQTRPHGVSESPAKRVKLTREIHLGL